MSLELVQVGAEPTPTPRRKETEKQGFINPHDFAGSYVPDWLLSLPRRDLPPGAKVVYIAIMRRYNRSKKCAWPGHDAIALQTGLSSKMVRRYISMLVAKGLLQVTRTRRSNQYRFPWSDRMLGATIRRGAVTGKIE